MSVADVQALNKAPPGYPEGDDIPPDAYLHMIVSKKYNILPPPDDHIKDEDIEEGSDLSYSHVSFRDCTHLGCRCTDIVFLIFFLIFLAIVLALALYLWKNSHVSINSQAEKCKVICYTLEIPKSYDSKEPFKCTRTNRYEVRARMEDKFEIADFDPLKPCMKDCNRFDNFEEFGHECVDEAGNATIAHQASEMELDSKLSELSFLGERITVFLILLGAPIALAMLAILMFKSFNFLWYWILILLSFLSVIAVTGYIIYLFLKQSNEIKEDEEPYPTMSVMFTAGWVLFTLYWFFLLFTSVVKKMSKAIHLTKFAASVTKCQLILYVLVSFFALTVIYILLILLSGAIETNGKLVYENKKITYERSNAKDVARALLLFTYWWTNHLVIACQHLVVARVVAMKALYGKTTGICAANGNLMHFHLGTACMASFIFSTFSFLKDIYEAFLRMGSVNCHPFTPSEYDMDYPRGGNCFKPISRVSYIPVCLFCEHLIPGGRKATFLFLQRHLMNWRATKHYYILIHAFILAIPTILFAHLSLEHDHTLENMMYSLVLATIHTYFIGQAAVGLFRMVVDTLFFCYCYDLALNDGNERPYITNPAFIAFVKNVPLTRPRKAKIKYMKEKGKRKKEEKPKEAELKEKSKETPKGDKTSEQEEKPREKSPKHKKKKGKKSSTEKKPKTKKGKKKGSAEKKKSPGRKKSSGEKKKSSGEKKKSPGDKKKKKKKSGSAKGGGDGKKKKGKGHHGGQKKGKKKGGGKRKSNKVAPE